MPTDLPLYRSESNNGIRRLKQNKRLVIVALVLMVASLFVYLNGRLSASPSYNDHDESPSPKHDTTTTTTDDNDFPSYPAPGNDNDADVDPSSDTEGDHPFSPSTHSDSHKHMTQPFDETTDNVVINTSKHYNQLVVVTADASSTERRLLIRDKYFGLRDNLLPCMIYNADVYYKFWIHGSLPRPDTPLRRRYEAEKMEWNDMVEVKNTGSFEQVDVLEWVETDLAAQGITYDYLILQDVNTFMQLDAIKQELDSGVISDSMDSSFTINTDAPTNFVWGTFQGDASDKDAVVVGSGAVKLALQHRKEIEATGGKDESILTSMYKYYQSYAEMMEQQDSDDDDPEQEALTRGQLIPEFVGEDGPEGTHRFIRWENNVESVHPEDIVVTQVYQPLEFTELAHWTQLKPTRVCHRGPFSAPNGRPLDDDEDTGLDEEENYKVAEQQLSNKSIAVVTSSFIYDACMEPSATRAAANKRQYAVKHGYSFVARSAEFAQEAARGQRKTVWGKIDVVEKVLPKYDWLFWLDMDAVIMDQDRRLEDLLDQVKHLYPAGPAAFDDRVDFVVARPSRDPMINAGVFLIRNTPWAMQFLRDVQKTQAWYNRGSSYEQGAMWDIMRLPQHQEKVFLLDRDDHTFNTFPKFYQAGDFVVHFAPDKCPNDATVKGLNAADKLLAGGAVSKLDLE